MNYSFQQMEATHGVTWAHDLRTPKSDGGSEALGHRLLARLNGAAVSCGQKNPTNKKYILQGSLDFPEKASIYILVSRCSTHFRVECV